MKTTMGTCLSLLLLVLAGCADGGGLAPARDELELLDAEHDALGHVGITHVVTEGEQRWRLMAADDTRRGQVLLGADGAVAAEVDGIEATFTEDETHLDIVCADTPLDLTRDIETSAWIGHDLQSVSVLLAPCAAPLSAGRTVRAAAARAARVEGSVEGDVAGQPQELACNWRRIGDQMDRYTQMCQGWGYDQGAFTFRGCIVSLDYCINW